MKKYTQEKKKPSMTFIFFDCPGESLVVSSSWCGPAKKAVEIGWRRSFGRSEVA